MLRSIQEMLPFNGSNGRRNGRCALGPRPTPSLHATLESLESKDAPAAYFAVTGYAPAITAGTTGTVNVVAKKADGTIDASYAGTVHFASSDPLAVLPANSTLTNGVGDFNVALKTAGAQSLSVIDAANASIAGQWSGVSLSTAYSQAPSSTGAIYQSSWWDPDGSDYDQYVWDGFTLGSTKTISEIDWRGGYLYEGAYGGHAIDFTVAIYSSIGGGSQPNIVSPPLAQFQVGSNANETLAGTFGGHAMYDYSYTLPTAFQAIGGTKYWVQIEAWQHGIPEWGFTSGSSGDGAYFRRIAYIGDAYYQLVSGNAAFTLKASTTLNSIVVSPAPTSQLLLTGLPAQVNAGAPANFSVAAKDAYGNVTPGYTGMVHFSSSDLNATLPTSSSLTNGVGAFTVTFATAGAQSISANDAGNAAIAGTANISVHANAPTIVGVYFDGTIGSNDVGMGDIAWDPMFRNAAGNKSYGYPAPAGSEQSKSLPWSTIDTVYIQFNENVNVSNGSLGVRGLNVAAYATSMTYDNVKHVAKFTFATNLKTDRIMLDLAGTGAQAVTNAAGVRLAGTWSEGAGSFPTSGPEGVNFQYRFVVGIGDVNRNGLIRNDDLKWVRSSLGQAVGDAGYKIALDLDGNGRIDNADVNIVRSNLFLDPPSGPGPFRPIRSANTDNRNYPNLGSRSPSRPTATPTGRTGEYATTWAGLPRRVVKAQYVNSIDSAFEEMVLS